MLNECEVYLKSITSELGINYNYNYNYNSLVISDHMGGFDITLNNEILNNIINIIGNDIEIETEYVVDKKLHSIYNNLMFNVELKNTTDLVHFLAYNIHPTIKFENFVCSFNGSPHVSRQLLTSIINKMGYFDSDYCSKNFNYSNEFIVEQLNNLNLNDNDVKLYRKFFQNDIEFNENIYSFGHVRYDHASNIYNLEDKLTQSFIHIVSETMATSYYPFVTEKFLYSIVTRGLFLAYAQPQWHAHLSTYYGFKQYNKIFDYSFDEIKNPVKRLIRLMEMISKFAHLSVDDWVDLYQMEMDAIEYNYDHYFSKQYLEHLKQYDIRK